jgi:hypothetical protein
MSDLKRYTLNLTITGDRIVGIDGGRPSGTPRNFDLTVLKM